MYTSLRALAAALHSHAAHAERGSFLERDLMAAADALIAAEDEIAGLAEMVRNLRAALETRSKSMRFFPKTFIGKKRVSNRLRCSDRHGCEPFTPHALRQPRISLWTLSLSMKYFMVSQLVNAPLDPP